ncbi:MAG: DUF72 domain-containing protein [Verrucomicrobia bacterium]|nr:MAG: DUF72 domain-containing protein [Verrucomicrobiota bacterium]PYK71916.1 MAG: DUF72 domain-containing protein [Verrucomicrobiota bacterium]
MKPWIGTSGFQYTEWKGTFYPEDLPANKMLPFYAERFSTTEINYTFHRIPAAKTIDNWKQLTPDNFRFALKAPQKITHWSKLRDCADTLRYFYDVVSGLGEKLGPVLFQLPPNFRKDTFVLGDFVNGLPGGMRAAFEFRHESWFDEEVFDLLKTSKAALCIADSEKLTAPKVSTANWGYLRLRREDYSKIDIEHWVEFVRAQRGWDDVFIYFKHEEAGIGPKLAAQMTELLA